ncbi:MAG: hypothetical protein AAFV38_15880, partial [Pseudomonadota bacterium]
VVKHLGGSCEPTVLNNAVRKVDDEGTPTGVGEFGGVFGGEGATSAAGAVVLTNIFGPDSDLSDDLDRENGVFILPKCTGDPAEDPASCNGANP